MPQWQDESLRPCRVSPFVIKTARGGQGWAGTGIGLGRALRAGADKGNGKYCNLFSKLSASFTDMSVTVCCYVLMQLLQLVIPMHASVMSVLQLMTGCLQKRHNLRQSIAAKCQCANCCGQVPNPSMLLLAMIHGLCFEDVSHFLSFSLTRPTVYLARWPKCRRPKATQQNGLLTQHSGETQDSKASNNTIVLNCVHLTFVVNLFLPFRLFCSCET